jgi:protein TonB
VEAARRHAVTWSVVAAAHLAAAAAVVGGAPASLTEPVREGGLLLVVSVTEPEPIAPAGEAPAGTEAGAGASTPPPADPVVAVSAPSAPAVSLTGAPVERASVASSPAPVVTEAPSAPAPRPPVLEPPAFLVREEPSYPSRARRAGSEGRVVVKVLLSASGEVTALVVHESSGSALLDEAALAAARASRFTPARRDGVAEPSEALAAYRFELR